MNLFKLNYLVVVILYMVLLSNWIQAQPTRFSGNVIDRNGNGIEAVIINLFSNKDTMLNTFVTNSKGEFTLIYDKSQTSNYITINKKDFNQITVPVRDITNTNTYILLPIKANELKEVSVVAKRDIIDVQPTLITVQVEGNSLFGGGTAIDVLSKTPRVLVDPISKSITVDGKSNILVYINNRQMMMTQDQLTRYLESISASSISKIEVNTSPSAKYDASGGAVVNIFLKKGQDEGFSGDLSASPGIGRFEKFSSSINLSIRNKKVGAYLIANQRLNHTFYSYRMNQLIGNTEYVNIDHYRTAMLENYSIKSGVDYQISAKTSFNLTLNTGYVPESMRPTSNTSYFIKGISLLPDNVEGRNYQKSALKNLGFGFGLKQDIDKGNITVDGDYVQYIENNTMSAWYKRGSENFENSLSSNFPYKINIGSLKSDFTKKINDNVSIEFGAKLSSVKIENNPSVISYTSSFDSLIQKLGLPFRYNENLGSFYGSTNLKKGRFSSQLGYRLEHTDIIGISGSNTFRYLYYTGFPQLNMQFATNTKYSFSLNINKRITRPNFTNLNPAYVYLDPFTIYVGNPLLVPQISKQVQFGITSPKKVSFTAVFQKTNHRISEVLFRSDTIGTVINTFINFDYEKRLQSSLSVPVQISSKWKSQVTLTGLYLSFYSSFRGSTINNQGYGIINWTNTFKINNRFSLDAQLMARSKAAIAYLKYPAIAFVNAGANYSILNGRGNIKFTGNDIFHTLILRNYGQYIGTNVSYRHFYETQQYYFTFNYKFGNLKMKSVNKKSAPSSSEQERYKEI